MLIPKIQKFDSSKGYDFAEETYAFISRYQWEHDKFKTFNIPQ